MTKFIFFLIFLTISVNALNLTSEYKYDVFKFYKKNGEESISLKKDLLFVMKSKLNIKYENYDNKIIYELFFKDETLQETYRLNIKANEINKNFHFNKKYQSDNSAYIPLKDNTYIFEPLLVSTLYPIIKSNKSKIKIFIPSERETYKAKLLYKGITEENLKNKHYKLKKYILLYKNRSIEILEDKTGTIIFVNWSSIGYTSEIKNLNISSFGKITVKKNYKLKIYNMKIGAYKVKIYKYLPVKKKKNKKILIIDGVMFPTLKNDYGDIEAENIFFNRLINKLTLKGYTFLRYSFEDFSPQNIKTLTLSKKYEIVKRIYKHFKGIKTIISLGWGNYIALKLSKDFNKKIKNMILLNPAYFNFFLILKKQTDLEFLTLKEKKKLKKQIKKLKKEVSEKDFVFFNNRLISSNYFKELFSFNTEKYFKYLKNQKIYIISSTYDSEIDSKNSWYLYSKIKNENVKYKEFTDLNHYFYKIPYKSFAFSYNKTLKPDRDFLKYLKRILNRIF